MKARGVTARARGMERDMVNRHVRRALRASWRVPMAVGAVTWTGSALATEPVVFEAGPDWDVIVNGQLRPRVYASSGADFRGGASDWSEVVTQRARLGVMAEEASGLAFKVELQDVRVWGEETGTLSDTSAAGLDLRQAFAYLPLVDTLSLKIGRQQIAWGNERLVGAFNWSQRSRTFDGARVAWSGFGDMLRLDGIYAKIQETGQSPEGAVPFGRSGDVDFGGVRASLEYYPEHELTPLYLVRSDLSADELRHTIGLSANGRFGGFRYGAEFYYQMGDLAGASIDALMAAVDASYTVDIPQAPRIAAWGTVLSGGNGDPAGTFDTLYASNHRFYGEMDFFLDIPTDTANLGLVDLGGQLGTGIVDDLRLHVDFHHFRTEDAAASGAQVLGHEVDAAVRWQIHDYVSLRALYGHFWPGSAMRGVATAVIPTLTLPRTLSSEDLVFLTLDVSF
jgi:hypothetical protein